MMSSNAAAFIKLIRHPVKFRMFLLSRLPNAYFAGVRVKDINENSCTTMVPYKWFTRNPFRSTYFACLSMAAEMSTGALCLAHLFKRKPSVSMLVVKVEAEYLKKAVGVSTFVCDDGAEIKNVIEEAVKTYEPKIFRARSIGKNNNGEIIAEFFITWSFKAKNNLQ